ncbi:hypothetical protein O8I67_05045 [Streptococcus uberis]|uniref:hypothetical protein n=1 Tax=Streptococcus uberis TaxID=1349 RepID=UPI0022B88D91|nr:hypothetical protein [Streptococcus uberis]MCK1257227.1 hypothetical protein [Streptococcus uberis]MCZ8466426.1 hypothetical protein [Streptococcus uberis]
MNNLIEELCSLTIDHKLKWLTIDNLIIDGHAYSENFQHIIAEKSYFTSFKNQTIIILYGEVRDFINQRTVSNFFIQSYTSGQIERLEFPEVEIVKLHTIISLTL